MKNSRACAAESSSATQGRASVPPRVMARDPFATEDILAGFYRPVPKDGGAGPVGNQKADEAEGTHRAVEHMMPVAQGVGQAVGTMPAPGTAEPLARGAVIPSVPGGGEARHAGPPGADEADEEDSAKVVQEAGKKPKPSHYKIVCISLYNEDIARLESLVAELKRRGYSKANKSQLIRAALEQIDLDKVPKIP